MIAQSKLNVSIVDDGDDNDGNHNMNNSISRTDLDSHTNMVVLGKHSHVGDNTGKIAQISPFTLDYKSMENISIASGSITYEHPYSEESYVMICHNTLHIPSMLNILTHPFIMRKAEVTLNDLRYMLRYPL